MDSGQRIDEQAGRIIGDFLDQDLYPAKLMCTCADLVTRAVE